MKKLSVSLSILLFGFVTNSFADSAKLVNPANNHVYKRFDKAVTWTQAKTACANQKGYLASITSQTENDWVWSNFGNGTGTYAGSYKGFWLGGNDLKAEGQWQWINGETWSYSNWDTGQPDNASGGGQNYTVMWNHNVGGTWDDGGLPYSNDKIYYLCEWDKPLKNYTSMITADTNNDNVSEFVLVGNNGSVNKVVSIDRQNKTVVSEVDFSAYPIYSGISLSVVDDMNNNGKAEFSLLLTKKSDGSNIIETRDSGTGELLESYVVPR